VRKLCAGRRVQIKQPRASPPVLRAWNAEGLQRSADFGVDLGRASGFPLRLEICQSIFEGLECLENQPPQKHRARLRAVAAAPPRTLVDCEEFVRVDLHFAHLLLAVRVADRLEDAAAKDLDVRQHCVASLTPLMRLQDLLDFVVQRPRCQEVPVRVVDGGVHDVPLDC